MLAQRDQHGRNSADPGRASLAHHPQVFGGIKPVHQHIARADREAAEHDAERPANVVQWRGIEPHVALVELRRDRAQVGGIERLKVRERRAF